MQRRLGITFVFVTHDQEEALAMSDEDLRVEQWSDQQAEHPWTSTMNPVTGFVADFIGESNIVLGR